MSDMWSVLTVEPADNEQPLHITEEQFLDIWGEHVEHEIGFFDTHDTDPAEGYIEVSGWSKYEVDGLHAAAEAISALGSDLVVTVTEEWTGEGGPSRDEAVYVSGQVTSSAGLEEVKRDADGLPIPPRGTDVTVEDQADASGAWVELAITDTAVLGKIPTLAFVGLTAQEARALSADLLKAANASEFRYRHIERQS